jgi:predicted AlkP superfamily phosphohydrolase/phosphomutase
MSAPKVAVIGIDAADWEFLDPWIRAGDLPAIASLVEEGARGPLRSTDPPVSAPAWATFMTGLDPGAHGLYDFLVEDPRSGRPLLARADLIRGRRLWEVAADAGRKSVVVNVPITWPPRPFPGLLVTGMLTPEGSDSFAWPRSLAGEIRAAFPGYRCDVDVALKGDPAALKAHIDHLAGQNAGVMRTLLRRGPWDLFVGVFTTTDRAQHLYWARREEFVRDHYRRVDRMIGDLLADIGPEALVVLLSDHGFHSVRTKFYMNRWLRDNGWLATRATPAAPGPGASGAGKEDDLARGAEFFRAPGRRRGLLARLLGRGDDGGGLEVDPGRTRAYLYSVWTGGVKVNLRGRSSTGIVEPGQEYERLRDDLIAGLRGLRHPGTDAPLFDFVGRREEVWHGPMLDWAPDVVTRSEGFVVQFGKNLDRGRTVRESAHEQGTHSDTGVLVLRGPGVRKGARIEGARLADAMPTVLWALGLDVPAGLDGRVLAEAFTDEVRAARPVRTSAASAAGPAAEAGAFDAAEEEELRKTLEGLGYI